MELFMKYKRIVIAAFSNKSGARQGGGKRKRQRIHDHLSPKASLVIFLLLSMASFLARDTFQERVTDRQTSITFVVTLK